MSGPVLVVLTDRLACAAADHDLVEVCALAVGAGADAVLVREKDLPNADRRALVRDVVAAVGGGRTLVAERAAPVREVWEAWREQGVAGLHLAAAPPARGQAGPGQLPGPGRGAGRPLPFGRSCHDAAELAAATAEGAAWVTVSPVAGTASKPGYGPALGSAGLARLVARVPPDGPAVLALGGVDAANAGTWPAAGAAGVAVMGAVMRAGDPAAVVSDLVDAVRRPARRARDHLSCGTEVAHQAVPGSTRLGGRMCVQ